MEELSWKHERRGGVMGGGGGGGAGEVGGKLQ